MMDYTADLIINARPLPIELNGQTWHLRQPTPDETLDGESAFRLTYDRVMGDKRLEALAENEVALKTQALKRASAAEALYMLPLLMLDETQKPLFNIHSPSSLEDFEKTNSEIIATWVTRYFELTRLGVDEVKKK